MTTTPLPPLPPHDEYLERGVLGAVLTQPDPDHSAALLADLAPFLEPRDFFRERHRLLYAGALSAYHRDGHALFGDVVRRLRGGGRLDALGGTAYLAGLCADALPALVVRGAALALAELGLERLLLEARRRLPATAADPRAAAADLAAFHRRVADKQARLAAARAPGTPGAAQQLRNSRNTHHAGAGPVGIEIP